MLASALRDELLLWPCEVILAFVVSQQFASGDNVRDMVARLRARECALPNLCAFCHLRVLIRLTHCLSPRLGGIGAPGPQGPGPPPFLVIFEECFMFLA